MGVARFASIEAKVGFFLGLPGPRRLGDKGSSVSFSSRTFSLSGFLSVPRSFLVVLVTDSISIAFSSLDDA